MTAELIPPHDIQAVVRRALDEDLGAGDLCAKLIDKKTQAQATIMVREDAVLCGTPWVNAAFELLDQQITLTWHAQDGDHLQAGDTVCNIQGPAATLLSAERTALNFLQLLSGTATTAAQYAYIIKDTDTRILDTRKTIPGLRLAQKYAVRCGGCFNHRMGLYDEILIKENHIKAAGSIAAAIAKAQQYYPDTPCEIEVETLDELNIALQAGAKRILLDNFEPATLKKAVALNQGRSFLEASGGINLQNIKIIADTGIDAISIGTLTKDIRAIDFSMRLQG